MAQGNGPTVEQAIDEVFAEITQRFTDETAWAASIPFPHDLCAEFFRSIRGACRAAASGNPRSTVAAIRSLGTEYTAVVQASATAVATQLDEHRKAADRIEQLEVARRQLETAIADERTRGMEVVRATRSDGDRATAALEHRILEIETMLTTSSSTVIHNCTAFARGIVERMDAGIRQVTEHAAQLERLLEEDIATIHALESVETGNTLDDELTAIVQDVAPLRGSPYFNLTEAERSRIPTLSRTYDTITERVRQIAEILPTIERERAAHDGALARLGTEWATIDHDFRSAVAIFPMVFHADVFALARVTQAEITQKQRCYGETRQRAAKALGDLAATLRVHRARYEAVQRAVEPIRSDIQELAAFTDIAWFRELSTEDRQLTSAVVLTFRPSDRQMSRPTIAEVLVRAGLLHRTEDVEEHIAEIFRPGFFRPTASGIMQERIRSFSLTDAAVFWRDVWTKDFAELAERIRSSREEFDRDQEEAETTRKREREQRAQEREERKREREAALAVKRAAHEDPLRIRAALDETERQLLATLSIGRSRRMCPEDVNVAHWAKLVVAAVTVGIIPNRRPPALTRAWMSIITFNPPLLVIAPNAEGQRRITTTTIAERVVDQMATVPTALVHALDTRFHHRVSEWPDDAAALFHAVHTSIMRAASELTKQETSVP